MTIVHKKKKTNSSKVKSSVKRMSKFTNFSSKGNNKKRKKLECNNTNDKKKEHLKRG